MAVADGLRRTVHSEGERAAEALSHMCLFVHIFFLWIARALLSALSDPNDFVL